MRKIIAIPADLHCGSTVGLIPSGRWNLTDGGTYSLTKSQKLIWKQWDECWKTVSDLRKEKESKLIITFNGDLVDGDHHGTNELVTRSKEEQERIATDCIDYALNAGNFKPDHDVIQFTKGTPCHVGNSEERLARDFDARPQKPPIDGHSDGRFVFDRVVFSANGVLIDVAHHGFSVGRRAWTKDNTMRSMLKSMYFDSLRSRIPLPRYVVRSHMHQYVSDTYQDRDDVIQGVITPCFQNSTHYVNQRVTGAQLQRPVVGMYIIVVEKNGQTWDLCPRFEFPDEKVVKL